MVTWRVPKSLNSCSANKYVQETRNELQYESLNVRKIFSIAAYALISLCFLLSPLEAFSAQDPCLNITSPAWSNNQIHFTFFGKHGVNYVIESSADLQQWVSVATNSEPGFTRFVTLDAPSGASFYRTASLQRSAGFIFTQGASLNGNNITVDAYDSADTNHFPNGLWNSTHAFAGGNVAALAGVLNVGNAKIHGRLLLAPGVSYSLGSQCLVGDLPANWPVQSGLQSEDWLCNQYQFNAPDVVSPYSSGLLPLTGADTNSYVLQNGNYYVNGNFLVSHDLQISGLVTLYVTGDFSANSITVQIGSVLRLYVGQATGASVSAIMGNINNPGNAYNLQFFGLPTCSTISLTGTNGYLGTIYAPQATLAADRGITPFDYQGASVTKSMVLNGHINLHFDQNLSR